MKGLSYRMFAVAFVIAPVLAGMGRSAKAGVVRATPGRITAGALGDSLTDEYQFADDPPDRRAARNFVELLASTHRLDFGTFTTADRGSPRRQGYANNWALSGARTSGLPAQTAGLAAQAAGGKVDYAFILVGGNDFRDIATGAAADPQAALTAGITSTVTAARTLLAANPDLRLAVANVPDVTMTPEARFAVAANPALAPQFAQLSGLVDAYNAGLAAQFAADERVAVVDANGLFNHILADPVGAVPGLTLNTRLPGRSPDHLFVDSIHPGTVGQGLLANAFIDAVDTKFGENVRPLRAGEILAAANAAAGGGPTTAVPLPPAAFAMVTILPLVGFSLYRLGRGKHGAAA